MKKSNATLLGCLVAVCLLLYPLMISAEMIVRTKDGRTLTLQVSAKDVKSIEFSDAATGSMPSATGSMPYQEVNLASGKSVQQSSTGFNGAPGRAVDGNTSGHYGSNSVTHTNSENQAWWQVDLGRSATIRAIRVWNRTDCCSERLSQFYVLVSESPFVSNDLNALLKTGAVWHYYVAGQAGTPSEIPVNRRGRYVRIQLAGTNYLSLAEVQVLGY